jgi:nucleoside-diphosphate-sugar epimerase
MHIAITGSSGRVGSAIVEMALADGHSIVSIDRVPPARAAQRPNVSFVQADITDYAAFEGAMRGCDALVHMAAIPGPGHHPDHVVHNNNVVGSYNALRAAAELGIKRICQASSINAVGAAYSRMPRFDYFPLDEHHPTYSEDPYSLSKWICELQAESIARRYEDLTIASLRFHGVVPDRATMSQWSKGAGPMMSKHLWGYTRFDAAARACLLSLSADYKGAEAFFIVGPDNTTGAPSLELARQFFPDVPVTGDLSGQRGFFDCSKAERLLGWTHPAGTLN